MLRFIKRRLDLIMLTACALFVFVASLLTAKASTGPDEPGRRLELIEGHKLICVLAYNPKDSMAASGSTAIWCTRNGSAVDSPFRITGR